MIATYVGIDPGLSGALARLTQFDNGTEDLKIYPVPVAWSQIGDGKRRVYDVRAMYQLLVDGATLVAIERQQAMPPALRKRGQGVTSSFSIGFGYGLWVGLLTARNQPHAIVTPRRWRMLTGLQGADKTAIRLAAQRRFPTVRIPLDHADAVMLAVTAAREDVRSRDLALA